MGFVAGLLRCTKTAGKMSTILLLFLALYSYVQSGECFVCNTINRSTFII